MEKNKKYVIPFVGLSAGKHLYDYNIGDSFFEDKEYSEIKKGSLKLHLVLSKHSEMLVLQFSINGTVNVLCDRCNEPFDMPVSCENELVVKTSNEESNDDEVVSIPSTESEIDLSEHIYENIVLSLPLKKVHPDKKKGEPGCNEEALKIYNKYVIQQEKTEAIDPRWEKLKGLIK